MINEQSFKKEVKDIILEPLRGVGLRFFVQNMNIGRTTKKIVSSKPTIIKFTFEIHEWSFLRKRSEETSQQTDC